MGKHVNMPDRQYVETTIISSEDKLAPHLPKFISSSAGSLLVGFDTEWMFQTGTHTRAKIAMLKLCNTSKDCLLIELHRFQAIPRCLVEFLAIRDIKFVGVDISKQLEKLKEDYGLEIRTTVDLTSVALEITRESRLQEPEPDHDHILLMKPWRVLLKGLEMLRRESNWWEVPAAGLDRDREIRQWLLNNPWECFGDQETTYWQFEYVVFSAYAAVNCAQTLLESSDRRASLLVR